MLGISGDDSGIGMTDDEFERYLANAIDELEAKREYLRDEFGFGRSERYVVDYTTGVYTVFVKERPIAEAQIFPIATHVTEKKHLKWVWANDIYPDVVREEATQVIKLHSLTGFEMFKDETVECDESMAWEITALACKYLDKMGAFRVPHKGLHAHALVKRVKRF